MENMKKCPVCKKPSVEKKNPLHPFCSERCKLVDLGKWAMGDYRIAGEKVKEESPGENETGENFKEK